ncbi:MAG: hypothetical protein COA96_03675 [SAR86 cluster bacterium]|uniref:Glycosyltransferase subfamily 4-like N-terminal domain-containing protein n=1 Tax=SAR86 cluster bacterium TaxID=2030880 RepID=A0A2A5B744_9GAMM|nr:MAG: hypothetical protein COA96_03675 [SAR86 cluster bacterium]
MTKSVLFIAHYFPPVGGAGVQRAAKFVKYLPGCGWAPTILTVKNPSVPLFDESLLQEIPDTVKIYKAKTLEPSYKTKQAVSASAENSNDRFSFSSAIKGVLRRIANVLLQPDPQILWLPAAAREAKKILNNEKFDVIVATAPPFSSLILGAYLAKKFNIPLVLDYRDEWDISNSVWENKKTGNISLAIQKRMQRYAIERASAIVATSKMSVHALQEKTKQTVAKPEVRCIYNGFDAEDFTEDESRAASRRKKYVLAYVGTLWNLTSIEPVVAALLKLEEDFPELVDNFELVVAGRRTAEQEQLLSKLGMSKISVVVHDYLEHGKALDLMREADGQLLLLSDLNMARRVIPAKIFEYMASLNSIFVVAPEGEVWELVKDYPRAFCIQPSAVEEITQLLALDIQRFLQEGQTKVSGFNPNCFERRSLTAELSQVLELVTSTDA